MKGDTPQFFNVRKGLEIGVVLAKRSQSLDRAKDAQAMPNCRAADPKQATAHDVTEYHVM